MNTLILISIYILSVFWCRYWCLRLDDDFNSEYRGDSWFIWFIPFINIVFSMIPLLWLLVVKINEIEERVKMPKPIRWFLGGKE